MLPDGYPPIGDYALIGDCHSAALVCRDGSIDWCCFHRFDARPVFSRILDRSRGGHFRLAPTEAYESSRRYAPGTNILETTFRTDHGVLVLRDCFPIQQTLSTERGDSVHPHHQLVREVRCTEGRVTVEMDFRPRFDYGTTVPRLDVMEDGLVQVYGGADALVLQTPADTRKTEEGRCINRTAMREGDRGLFALHHQWPHEVVVARMEEDEIVRRLEETEAFWRDWSDRCSYDGPYREEVIRSALVLKALTNAPTGAIVAAPTTSLPERIGGVRNWDYRYTWLRDASFTLYALFSLGYIEEAHDFMNWLKRTTAGRGSEIQVLYGVGGEHLLPEFEIPQLEGYRGSRPVRVGNAAINQFQLDTYGELFDTAWLYHRYGGEIDQAFWDLLQGAAECIVKHWEEPDEGIWEVRGGSRHFVFSKVMCWVGLERAVRLAEALDLPADLGRWRRVRDEIRERVLREGVDEETGAFVQAFGTDALDAANLLLPLVHFLPADDPRMVATVKRTEDELTTDGLVHRYLDVDDGLPHGEGAFLLCSFWLVDNLAMQGRLDEAHRLFEKLCGYANDVGLLSEEVDPTTGELLGNFPQGFSHLGLINAALNLQEAERRGVSRRPED